MKITSILCFALVCLGSSGCKSDSGIIVAVSGQSVEELEFQVAKASGDRYIIEPSLGVRYGVQGRDLRSDPFELLLQEENPATDTTPPTLRVLALGYQANKIVAFALTEPSQIFIRGELLRRTLALRATGSGASAGTTGLGCFSVTQDSKSFLLANSEDLDCDGYSVAGGDCDDNDSSTYPGAPQICDGVKHDCVTIEESEQCYTDSNGSCLVGTRQCVSAKLGSCEPGSSAAPAFQCAVYADCASQQRPLLCLHNRSFNCTLEYTATGTCAASRTFYAPVSGGKNCQWNITDNGGWPVGPETNNGCEYKLTVEVNKPNGTGVLMLKYTDTDEAGTARTKATVAAAINPKLVDKCSSQPLTCEKI